MNEKKFGLLVSFDSRWGILPYFPEFRDEAIHKKLGKLGKLVGADLIDVVRYNDSYDIVIDDCGLLKMGNPVFEVGQLYLAGKLLFLKRLETPEGIELVGMSEQEAISLCNDLNGNIKVIGITG